MILFYSYVNKSKKIVTKIFILGANSTGGAYATYFFSKRGYETIASSRSKQAAKEQLPYLFYDCPSVKYINFDINWETTCQLELLKSFNPDYILNFASQSMVAQSWINPQDWMRTNCVGQVKLLEALKDLNSLKRYIHFSTPEVYGNTSDWINESHPFNPSTPYAASRAFGDINTRIWSKTFSIPTTITRAANIYSEGQHLYRIIPRTIHACFGGAPITIDGDGKSVRSFIHMEDVCNLLEKVLDTKELINEFHISPKDSISIIDLVKIIFKICDKDIFDKKHLTFGPERKGKDQNYLLDPQKAIEAFNWNPVISINEGLERVIEWYKKSDISKLPLSYSHKR